MSCSGQHFSIHSPDCKAHMSIQSNRPLLVDPLASNSRVTTPVQYASSSSSNPAGAAGNLAHRQATLSSSSSTVTNNYGQQQYTASCSSPAMLQIQTLTGGDCSQLLASPMSPVPGAASGQLSPLVGHHQASEGNYTLVILDCSPHPTHPADQTDTGAAGGLVPGGGGSGQRQLSSASCDSRCHSGCHCQTELIVRQQIEHDHLCQMQHADRGQQQQQQQQQQQPWQQQQQWQQQASSFMHRAGQSEGADRLLGYEFAGGSIADRPMNQTSSATTTTTTTKTETTTTAANRTHNNYDQRSDRTEHGQMGQPAGGGGGWQRSEQYERHDDQFEQRAPRAGAGDEPAATSERRDQLASSATARPSADTEAADGGGGQRRRPREGTRIVKRWNWNLAQFVEEEVPDRPQPKPQPAEPSTPGWLSAANQHQHPHQQPPPPPQQQQQQPRAGQTGLWNSEIESIRLELSPVGQQQYDPSWLAYRKPDEESVQADPLYRDLMLELQRLEDGVGAQQRPPPEPIITPDCFQKPVFGQPIQPANVELEEHESVEFIGRLIPTSDPSMRVEWTKNGQPLLESSRITSEYEFGVVRLAIKRCEAEDSGIYQCRASNSLGEAIARTRLLVHAKNSVQYDTLHPAGLDKIRQLENPRPVDYVEEAPVQQPPKFLTHIQDYVEKDEGDSVHFECNLAPVDDPDMKIEWFFNGRPLVTGSRFHTIDDFGFIVLDIDWLFPRDTGEYICRATNKHGTSFTRTVMRVRPAKNIVLDSQLDNADATIDKLRQLEFPDVPEEQPVEQVNRPAHFVQPLRSANNKLQFVEGDNVHFEARAGPATDGQLTVEWFHNDKPLISGHRFKPTFDFGHILLDILYVYPEDSGVYKCVARNQQGTASSELAIQVQGKQSIVYQSQLPREMQGGVEKITEMEAMWNRPPDPEEEEAPAERMAPQFVLDPKPCSAFEGSCARFCCRVLAHPRARVQWFINGQLVVSGSRYKLTYDGMHHLIIPKCLLSDAGKVEVRAKNLLGECARQTELKVKRKVDDYRGVLKNSPNPWYDEQTLKLYRRQRNQPEDDDDDEDFEEFLMNFRRQQQQQQQLKIATELQSTSPQANQLVGYMEPDTPDVNLLADRTPLVEPGDLHPVVLEQQAIHAPAPSTIKRAMEYTSDAAAADQRQADEQQHRSEQQQQQAQQPQRQVFGVGRAHAGAAPSSLGQQQQQRRKQQQQQHQHQQQQQQQQQQQVATAHRHAPPVSPENVEHGKEVHSHFHTQLQVERRPNIEITREIIEKETFEQEHKGFSKDSLTSVSEAGALEVAAAGRQQLSNESERTARSVTPVRVAAAAGWSHSDQQQQQQQQVLIEEHMIPPEFVQKIQPCQAIDGDEARFECQFRGEPRPAISWYRDNTLIKPSNLYTIETDFERNRSCLIIKRVTLNSNAVYTVKAENLAGSAKSSANLVVEAHPLPRAARGGQARQFDALEHLEPTPGAQHQFGSSSASYIMSDVRGFASPTASDYDDSLQGELLMLAGGGGGQQQHKVIKSVRTRRLSPDELASLIRASPDNLVAPTFLHTIHEVHAKTGELARLDARLIGSQPMEVKWLKDGQRVRADQQHKLLLEGDLYTLLILECSERDEGHYECVASNAVGEARCGASLRVSAEGRQSAASSSYVMQSISGGGAGQQQQQSSWRRPLETTETSRTMTTTSSASYSASSGGQQQQVPSAASSSSTALQSSAHGQQQQQRQHFGLTKQPHHQLMSEYTSAATGTEHAQRQQLPKLIKGLENQQVHEGKSVTLRCQISAFPKAEIAWFRQNDKQIKPSKYFRIFKDNDETHCLKILETFPEDAGEYKCVARAQSGQIETRAHITVLPSSAPSASGK
jgi:hypothetical protein